MFLPLEMERHPGWDNPGDTSFFPKQVWNKPHQPEYVHVVNSAAEARRVMHELQQLVARDREAAGTCDVTGREFWSRRIFACDTEVTDINPKKECPAGHGRVTCWSMYGGPDIDFRHPGLQRVEGQTAACVLYVDTFLDGAASTPEVLQIWETFRTFFESDLYPKVWHNYGFDKHVLQRAGLGIDWRAEGIEEPPRLRLAGFAGDTLHMARLHDAGRKGTKTYSLESLTGDKDVMGRENESVLERSKVGLKELFAVPKMMKSGKPSKSLRELPPIHEIQTTDDPVVKWRWVDYAAFDAKATWDLYHNLRCLLQDTPCKMDPALADGLRAKTERYTQWDLYLDLWRPFGELLTTMEQNGFYVDKEHLAEQQVRAEAELKDAEGRFRTWVGGYIGQQAARDMNFSSSAQIQTLLFGGFKSDRAVLKKPTAQQIRDGDTAAREEVPEVPMARLFKVDNPDYGVVLKAKKQLDFEIKCLWGTKSPLEPTLLTKAAGLPMTSAAALRVLCGRPGAAKKALAALDADNIHARHAAAAEALGDGPPLELPEETGEAEEEEEAEQEEGAHDAVAPLNSAEHEKRRAALQLGSLYLAFEDHKAGLEACAAVEALIEISAIETLLSSFIVPLQGSDVKAEDNRVHPSMNINTETGRLSCCKPNLQNQPALEKDRFFIRKAFRAEPGNTLVVADYGQLELRILAHMTNCLPMIDAFEKGGDFHSRTAAGMFDYIQEKIDNGEVAYDKMDVPAGKEMALVKDLYSGERRKAKILNFSIAYGKTAFGLAKDFGVSKEEAQQTVNRWYKSRQEVKVWQESTKDEARKDRPKHRVRTMMGRHRNLPGIAKKSLLDRGKAERAAINTPVQGSAADVVAAAMVRVHLDPRLAELGWKMLLQVHDEIIIEGPLETKDEAQARLVTCMEQPFVRDRQLLSAMTARRREGNFDWAEHSQEWDAIYHNGLRIALTVDANSADTWYEAK